MTFDLGGAYIQQLQTGGTETGTLTVDNNAAVNGDQSIVGGLTVGSNAEIDGSLGIGGSVLFDNAVNSVSAFRVQNASNTSIFTVDTTDSQILIGTTASTAGNCGGTLSGNGVCLSSSSIAYTGTARPTEQITLTAEYAGAILDPTTGSNNTGTMTAGIDKTGSNGYKFVDYYNWANSLTASQSYDIWVQVPIPKDFSAWSSSTPLTVLDNSSTTTAGSVGVAIHDSAGNQMTRRPAGQ